MSGQSHDGQIVDEALERGVAARPADAVEHDVAGADGGDEFLRLKPRQENAMVGGVQAERREGALQPLRETAR